MKRKRSIYGNFKRNFITSVYSLSRGHHRNIFIYIAVKFYVSDIHSHKSGNTTVGLDMYDNEVSKPYRWWLG